MIFCLYFIHINIVYECIVLSCVIEINWLLLQAYHDNLFEGFDAQELVQLLKEAESLNEQADIIHYLYVTKWVPDIDGRV